MDRRSWLWKRKSAEKCPGETESSGSVSSISERFSDDQEALRSSPVHASSNNVQSLDISSKVENHEVNETVKILNEKLTAALINITAKEDLVKQHSKVAEEAVAGWEKAENEVASLKKQLEATVQKNCALDGALKECVRQFRQSREEHEKKLNDTLSEKTNEWESKKCELETKISELQNSLETCKNNNDLHFKLQALMNENSTLIIERDLSNKAAELASKQHLDSIKKISKLDAECRKLRASMKKSLPYKENKSLNSSFCVESVADSQSDCCSESWASSIFELDHFKNENNKALSRNLTSHVDIEMMNDFLEMEKLAASSDGDVKENMLLEEKMKKIAGEKREVEFVLSKTRVNLVETENKLAELQRQLNSTNASKHSLESDMDAMELKRKELEFQLKAKNFEVKKLQNKVGLLETKCRDKEASELKREQLETELNTKNAEIKRLQEKIEILKIKSRDMDDLILKREEQDANLKSAHLEIEKLKEKINLLEKNIEDAKNISAKYEAKGQNVEMIEAEKIGLESKLISSQLEMEELQERISLLEGKLEEQMILSLNFQGRSKALEYEKEVLKSQLESAQYEMEKLKSKLGLLEKEIEAERETHSGLAIKCNVFEALLKAKIEEQKAQVKEASVLKSQFEFANLESKKLLENLKVVEKEIESEKKVSADFLIKNERLNKEIARLKQEMEHKQPKSFTRNLNTTKEVDLAQASSGKLAECQKTIYSISSQLKLLKDFNLMLDYEDSDLGDKENFINTSFSNYHDKSLRLASPSSSLNETESCFPQNRSCIQIQSQ